MYRTIDTSFWTDPAVRKLPPPAKLFFLYLITNPHAHVGGIYYLAEVTICHETGLKSEAVDTLWNTLSEAGLSWRDKETEVVWVSNMLRYQGKGSKILRSVSNQLKTLHNCSLIPDFLEHYPSVKRFYRHRVSDTPSEAGSKWHTGTGTGTGVGRKSSKELLSDESDAGGTTAEPSAESPKAKGKSGKAERAPKADSDTKALADFFRSRWAVRYGAAYAWVYGKDDKHAKWILDRTASDLSKAKGVCAAFLQDEDPWLAEKCHTINLLVSRFNQYQAARPAPAEDPETGFVRRPVTPELLDFLEMPPIDPEKMK